MHLACTLHITWEYHFWYTWTILFSKIYHMLGLSGTLSYAVFVYLCIFVFVFVYLHLYICVCIFVFVFVYLYLCICICVLVFVYLHYWLFPLIIGRIECISYSFSVYQGSLGWHFRSFCATRSQREAAIKYSGLVPHRALFRFLSLSLKKEKSQHISTGTAVALIWGIFCKIPQFKVFVGSKLLVFGKKKKKTYFGYNSFSG